MPWECTPLESVECWLFQYISLNRQGYSILFNELGKDTYQFIGPEGIKLYESEYAALLYSAPDLREKIFEFHLIDVDFYDFSEDSIFVLNMEEASYLFTIINQLTSEQKSRFLDLCNLSDDLLLFFGFRIRDYDYLRQIRLDFFRGNEREIDVGRAVRIWRCIRRRLDLKFQVVASADSPGLPELK